MSGAARVGERPRHPATMGHDHHDRHRPGHDPVEEKTLDANRYATKKTIAQGMLDIALLTANASQLKYILQVGKEHEFYTLMVTLISVSIILQAIQGILCLVLGSNYNINKPKEQQKANVWNNVVLALNVVITGVNVVLSAFDMRSSNMVPGAPAATRAAALPPGLPTAQAPPATASAPPARFLA